MAAAAAAAEHDVDDDTHEVAHLKCRMYENKYPEVDELVTVTVDRIEEMGAYVRLLEYNNIEGMILLSELSRRRIRSINKLIRVGRTEIVMVLRVDPEKGYIDLSKRRVAPDDLAVHEEKFTKSKTVHGIMRHVAETCHKQLEDLYQRVCWPLYKKYGHAYEAFRIAVTEPETIFGPTWSTEAELESLVKIIRRRLTPQPLRIRSDFELTCFHYEGVDALKAALRAGVALSTEEHQIKIKLVAPPLYVMSTQSIDKDKGVRLVQSALDTIQSTIAKRNGTLTVKMPPRAVGEREDQELRHLMDQLGKANEERSGDEDTEDEEDEGMGAAA